MTQQIVPGPSLPPDASTTVKGIAELSVAPLVSTTPIATGTNDPRMSDARTPTGSCGGIDIGGAFPNNLTLAAIGGGAIGPIGDATHVPVVTRDAKGRVTGLTSQAIAFPAAGGWTTAVDLDFTALGSQDFHGSDGNYTIGGFTFTTSGGTGAGTVANIATGVGITLTAGASNPKIEALLLNLAPNAEPWGGWFRIWVHRVASGISGASCNEIVGFGSSTWGVYTGLFDAGSGAYWLSTGETASTGGLGTNGPSTSNALGDATIVVQPSTPFSTGTFSGAAPSGGDFPAWGTLNKRGFVQLVQNSNANDPGPVDISVFFKTITASSSMVVKRLKVEIHS